ACGIRCHPPLAAHAGHHQGQPVLGLRIQRRGHPARGPRAAEPDAGRRRDGVLERVRGGQQPAPALVPLSLTSRTGIPPGGIRVAVDDRDADETPRRIPWTRTIHRTSHEMQEHPSRKLLHFRRSPSIRVLTITVGTTCTTGPWSTRVPASTWTTRPTASTPVTGTTRPTATTQPTATTSASSGGCSGSIC